MFLYGSKYYSDNIYKSFSDNDLRSITQLYKLKYWGLVDNETWKINDESALSDQGKIKTKYIIEDGRVIYLIRLEDCSHLLFLTQEDMDDNFEEKLMERIKEDEARMRVTMERTTANFRPLARRRSIAEINPISSGGIFE